MDRRIKTLLYKQIIDRLHILILTRVGGPQNHANTNRVLVHQVDRLLRVNDKAVLGAVHKLFVHLKVPRRLLPAHLHGGAHDDVGVLGRLAGGLTLVLPAFLHGQHGKHDGLRGPDARGADCADAYPGADRRVEEPADHADAAVLDVGALRVFFVVDEVLGEGLGHELFSFFFLRSIVSPYLGWLPS
jgi:hypothetical protein